ncbi:hypothetical protein M378DRAFT_170168 [Amanita muscaria Koide BX008]|uniref:Uncharacterized protein n=1 Tax=Amanita muscaria (strain Koide BX008) TaxID=946122 RepID=A0A0C2S7P0_AMAMK|nr:hypothetical protein M378DRAFT_170168 [Amanita muscaria Koide BX008]
MKTWINGSPSRVEFVILYVSSREVVVRFEEYDPESVHVRLVMFWVLGPQFFDCTLGAIECTYGLVPTY